MTAAAEQEATQVNEGSRPSPQQCMLQRLTTRATAQSTKHSTLPHEHTRTVLDIWHLGAGRLPLVSGPPCREPSAPPSAPVSTRVCRARCCGRVCASPPTSAAATPAPGRCTDCGAGARSMRHRDCVMLMAWSRASTTRATRHRS